MRRLMIAVFLIAILPSPGRSQSLNFELDASWPKPLPEKWITGQLGGVCTDSHDHVAVVNRRDITDEEIETGMQAPPILVFDRAGALVSSFGDPNAVPGSIHGCTFDRENNLYVAGNNDGIIQKYSHDGKLLMQIGTRGKFDSADGTGRGTFKNASREGFFNPAGMAIDPANGDIYVADGYGNKRVAVFDRDGRFVRQWGRKRRPQRPKPAHLVCLPTSCIASPSVTPGWSMSAIDRATASKCSTRAGSSSVISGFVRERQPFPMLEERPGGSRSRGTLNKGTYT